ncbi:hypothetical protein [Rugosimonospora africana]|uniref:hypothetical protein n=1 Tax=Rugosimonospora africana TaxID=556532 RepID=UPI001940D73E|nr:hypothetical protein [Rugosimonospora africana]
MTDPQEVDPVISIPYWARRLINRTTRAEAEPPRQLVDPRPVDAFHDKLYDGDAEACDYFKRNPGRWS